MAFNFYKQPEIQAGEKRKMGISLRNLRIKRAKLNSQKPTSQKGTRGLPGKIGPGELNLFPGNFHLFGGIVGPPF